MKLVSFDADGQSRIGFADEGSVVELIDSSGPAALRAFLAAGDWSERKHRAAGRTYAIADISHRPPVAEGAKIFCVGLNYAKIHPVSGLSTERPPQPTIFIKTVEALVGHQQPIRYPEGLSEQLDYEGELTVVLGRGGRDIAEADALSHVAGYTIMNEGSVRDWQKHSLFSGKNFFASGSCGPWVTTSDEIADPMDRTLVTRLNGDEVQRTSTGAMLFSIPQIIAHISRFMPLAPGDLIATGSPDGSGGSRQPQRFLRPGDRIEVEVKGLGVLSNVVESPRQGTN
ncbi:MAG: fumarylacetoacetate hydrolase family protein [Rhizobiales bacterium]|nr:fumarylacetoacetate hydrolase family protein [Hyphomicrobiales bacterium]